MCKKVKEIRDSSFYFTHNETKQKNNFSLLINLLNKKKGKDRQTDGKIKANKVYNTWVNHIS